MKDSIYMSQSAPSEIVYNICSFFQRTTLSPNCATVFPGRSGLVIFITTLVLLLFSHLECSAKTVGLLAGAGGVGDQSFNDMTLTGLGEAQQKYQFNLILEESRDTYESQEEALKLLLARGADVIVANGSGLEKLVKKYSPLHPKKYFLVNDFAVKDCPNVASTVFAHHEGSYLAGILAASITDTGAIGFIGGVDLPVIKAFFDGFNQGARAISSEVKISSKFIAIDGNLAGFENPQQGFVTATEMYQNNIDIIFSVAGMTGNGIIEAARRQNKLVIGVDSNQDHMAKGNVLTSMMKRLDRATYQEMVKIMENQFEPGVSYYSLKNGGVSLTPMKYTHHLIPVSVAELLRKTEQDIINGHVRIQTKWYSAP